MGAVGKYQSTRPDIIVTNFVTRDDRRLLYRSSIVENLDLQVTGDWDRLVPLVPEHPKEFLCYTRMLTSMVNIYYDKVIAGPVRLSCTSASFNRVISSISNNPNGKKVLIGKEFKPAKDTSIGRIGRDRSAFLTQDRQQ